MRLLFLFIEFDGNNEGNSSTNGLKWLFFFRGFFRGSGASSDFLFASHPGHAPPKMLNVLKLVEIIELVEIRGA